jgi:hypothetical protein
LAVVHPIAADQISYADLYVRWEQGNWRASEIDFTVDRQQWTNVFSDFERRAGGDFERPSSGSPGWPRSYAATARGRSLPRRSRSSTS